MDQNKTFIFNESVPSVPGFALSSDYDFQNESELGNLSLFLVNETSFSVNLNDDLSYIRSKRFMDETRILVQRILVPIVTFIGVVGNIITMIILSRRRMRSSTNNYLTALAISDLLYLLCVFSLSLRHHPDMSLPQHYFYWEFCRYGLWLTDASSKFIFICLFIYHILSNRVMYHIIGFLSILVTY